MEYKILGIAVTVALCLQWGIICYLAYRIRKQSDLLIKLSDYIGTQGNNTLMQTSHIKNWCNKNTHVMNEVKERLGAVQNKSKSSLKRFD